MAGQTSDLAPEVEEIRYWVERIERIHEEIRRKVVGHEELVDLLLVAILSEGHILLEGQPGLGKSLVINTLAETFSAKVKHVHYQGEFTGCNFLIIDELDRSGEGFRRELLTAMQERECIVNDELYYLDRPFIVMATINPSAYRQSEPLTPAELDRFMLCYDVPFLSREAELGILEIYQEIEQVSTEQVLTVHDVLAMQRLVERVYLPVALKELIVDLVMRTREGRTAGLPLAPDFRGISPRGSIYLATASRARAFLRGRTKVEQEDVAAVLRPVFNHRIRLESGAQRSKIIEELFRCAVEGCGD